MDGVMRKVKDWSLAQQCRREHMEVSEGELKADQMK
jgi:hypothetical protein